MVLSSSLFLEWVSFSRGTVSEVFYLEANRCPLPSCLSTVVLRVVAHVNYLLRGRFAEHGPHHLDETA